MNMYLDLSLNRPAIEAIDRQRSLVIHSLERGHGLRLFARQKIPSNGAHAQQSFVIFHLFDLSLDEELEGLAVADLMHHEGLVALPIALRVKVSLKVLRRDEVVVDGVGRIFKHQAIGARLSDAKDLIGVDERDVMDDLNS